MNYFIMLGAIATILLSFTQPVYAEFDPPYEPPPEVTQGAGTH